MTTKTTLNKSDIPLITLEDIDVNGETIMNIHVDKLKAADLRQICRSLKKKGGIVEDVPSKRDECIELIFSAKMAQEKRTKKHTRRNSGLPAKTEAATTPLSSIPETDEWPTRGKLKRSKSNVSAPRRKSMRLSARPSTSVVDLVAPCNTGAPGDMVDADLTVAASAAQQYHPPTRPRSQQRDGRSTEERGREGDDSLGAATLYPETAAYAAPNRGDDSVLLKLLAKNQAYEDKIAHLEAKNEAYKAEMKDLEEKNQSCQNEIKDLKTSGRKYLKAAGKEKDSIIDRLHKEAASKDETIRRLKKEVGRLEAAGKEKDSTVDRLQEEATSKDEAIRCLEKEITSNENLASLADALQEALKTLEDKMKALVSEKEALQEKADHLADDSEKLAASKAELEARLEHLQAEKGVLEAKNRRLEEEKESLTQYEETRDELLARLVAEKDQFKAAAHTKEQRLEKLAADNVTMKQQISELETEKQELLDENKSLRKLRRLSHHRKPFTSASNTNTPAKNSF